MKKVSLLIIVLFISFTYFNENAIDTLASQYSKKEVKVGEIYKSGDVINIEDRDGCEGNYCKDKFVAKYLDETFMSESGIFVFPQYDNKDIYWKITKVDIDSYYEKVEFNMEIFEYVKPELKVNCNANSLNIGESANCELNLKYVHDMKNMNFDLNTEPFEISDFKSEGNWNVDSIDNNKYSLSYSQSQVQPLSNVSTSKIATFTLTATDVESSTNLENNIHVNNIYYEDIIKKDSIQDDSLTLNITKKIEEEKKEEIIKEEQEEIVPEKVIAQNPKVETTENPPTGNKIPSFALIMIFTVIGVGLFLISKKYKLLIKL